MELWQLFMKFKAVMKVIGISFEIKITIILACNLALLYLTYPWLILTKVLRFRIGAGPAFVMS